MKTNKSTKTSTDRPTLRTRVVAKLRRPGPPAQPATTYPTFGGCDPGSAIYCYTQQDTGCYC